MALTDSLISYWELNEASGTRNDSHGSNHLTDTNTVTSNTGKVGNCGQFTAVNSERLLLNDNASISTGDIDFTIAAWVYADSFPTGADIILSKGTGNGNTPNDEFVMYYSSVSGGRFRFLVSNGSGTAGVATGNTLGVPATSNWYFIVAWHNSVANTVNIKSNNGTTDSVAFSAGGCNGVQGFFLGWDTVYGHWNGRIDQVGFWKRVLTADEITFLYNSGNGRSYADVVSGGAAFKAAWARGSNILIQAA